MAALSSHRSGGYVVALIEAEFAKPPACGHLVVAKDAVLVSDGRGAYGAFAHAENILHIAIITSRGEHAYKGFHIQNVNAYTSRLKSWLRPFRGVASWHLSSYLGWRRSVERLAENFTPERCLQDAYRCAST